MGRAFEPLRNHFRGRNEGCSRIPRFFASGRDGTSVFTGRKIAVGQKRTDRTKCRCRVSCVGFRTGMFAGRVGAWRNVRFFLRLCEDGPVLYGIWHVTCCYRMCNGAFVFADMRFFVLKPSGECASFGRFHGFPQNVSDSGGPEALVGVFAVPGRGLRRGIRSGCGRPLS